MQRPTAVADKSRISAFDSRVFWLSLLLAPAVWILFAFTSLLKVGAGREFVSLVSGCRLKPIGGSLAILTACQSMLSTVGSITPIDLSPNRAIKPPMKQLSPTNLVLVGCCLVLTGANVVGYLLCARDARKQLRDMAAGLVVSNAANIVSAAAATGANNDAAAGGGGGVSLV